MSTTQHNTQHLSARDILVYREDLQAHGITRFTDYVVNVINNGHLPGVLSGAELKGNARRYGGKYAVTRAKVAAAVKATCGVESELVNNRRTWAIDGEPVELTLATRTGAIIGKKC